MNTHPRRTTIPSRAIQCESLERRVLLNNAIPVGPEFQVNTFTAGVQGDPNFSSPVAMDAAGNFVLAWPSQQQDGDGWGVFARRYNAAGVPQGAEFQVNSYTTYHQISPSVAMDPSGNFVIAWVSFGDGSGYGVYAKRYNAAGQELGPPLGVPAGVGNEFRVNTYTTSTQGLPRVGMDADGDFVVAWQSDGQDSGGSGVYAQRFNAAGVPQGGEFRVNTYTTNIQRYASIGMGADGDFVITWQSFDQDGSFTGVYAKRYNAAGEELPRPSGVPAGLGNEFRVNTYTTSYQWWASVGMGADGDFVIAWHSLNQDGSIWGVYAKRYNAAGQELPRPSGVPAGLGNEFRVNTYATNGQWGPGVGMDPAGNFIIAWASTQDGSVDGVYAKRYNAAGQELPRPSGAPAGLGNEFRVNTYTTQQQEYPSVGMDADGDFVVTWRSDGQDGSDYGVYAQRYALQPEVTGSEFDFATGPQALRFTFDREVGASLGTDELILKNLTTNQTILAHDLLLSYDATTNTASITYTGTGGGFTGVLSDGNYRATLLASGITTPAGASLPSDHTFDFFFLNGDANRDGAVNLQDFNILAANFGQSNRDFTQGDFNYDTVVNLLDFNVLAARFGQLLPASTAPQPRFGLRPIVGDHDRNDSRLQLEELS